MSTLFLRNPQLLAMSVLLLLAAGVSAIVSLPRIEDPRITNRTALVSTPYPGASAARVESLVTEKLERRLRELAEIRDVESVSRAGVSLIPLELEGSIGEQDNEVVFSKIRDTLVDAARGLPSWERVGEVMIVESFETTALGILTQSIVELKRGARLVMTKGY